MKKNEKKWKKIHPPKKNSPTKKVSKNVSKKFTYIHIMATPKRLFERLK